MLASEYYSLPTENVRTYPVYEPGREPEGYWDMLQRTSPKALIETDDLNTEADWIAAGRRVFDELDHFSPADVRPEVHHGGADTGHLSTGWREPPAGWHRLRHALGPDGARGRSLVQ